tara:strand:+ start:254 stop:940 length:687 start_codon:yes stop_codon:yes gene_type:complete
MFSFDVDFVQRVKVTGIFCLQIYKILTGTLLTIFVPQSCETFLLETNTTENRVCTLTQNYENNDFYHQKTMYWNITTMVLFLGYYIIELKRENWSIKYLDIDNDKPDNSLKEIIKNEPKLDKVMDRLNIYYYNFLLATIFAYTVNVGLMIRIIYTDYHGSSTVSCFMSFVLLVLMKLYNSFVVARESIKNDKMMSAYMSEFVSYNVLDSDYLAKKNMLLNKKIKGSRP